MAELPCDADGKCMVCKVVPEDSQVILCNSCSSPWHMSCLHPPMTEVPLGDWSCPDCDPSAVAATSTAPVSSAPPTEDHDNVVSQIRAIRSDPTLSEQEKARKCQDVMSRADTTTANGAEDKKKHKMLEIFDENLNCIFCMQLADRPVTTPCGHNFCLRCFQRWVAQGKKHCGKCRTPIPSKMASQPRINSALVVAIRMAKSSTTPSTNGPAKPYLYIQNQDRPDKCFTTERAKKSGKANAASGKIFVTIPPDHFGPITAENDPVRGQGVLVGETWEDRMECRQWGAHFPHVAGIAGQSDHGAQSVALSGGYEDDEDHGEWFLYTGSGGRDLSGNKRTNDKQSFDQKFDKSNLALKVSCKRGYPVRVVRSHKEKRSSYAPETGVRYDGIYRIEKCWRKNGIQGFKVCRYLFVRCDNEPAPWTSDQIGDRPRPLPKIPELKEGVDLTERKAQPAWDWKEEEGVWSWVNPPPASRKTEENGSGSRSGSRKSLTIGQRLLKEFGCGICKKVLKLPLSTPCGHNFCKLCLESAFSGQKDVRERVGVGGRSLRAQKVVKRCPTCQGDISELLQNPQVNRQMEDVIQSLKRSSQDDSDEESAEGGDEKYEKRGGQADAAEKEMPNHTEDNNGPSKLPQGAHSVLAQSSNGVPKLKLDPLKEEQFMKICERFPEYSEDLLRSMLADQDGDLDELEGMLRTLQKEERKRTRKELQDAKKRGNKNGGVRGEEEEEENDGEKGRPRKKRKKEKEEEEEGA
ncbi:hypothetical protein GOP47_0024035 [Adiantum capillus-veneris]|uniref:RING-type E3 ubiquitin transferase n=1 Tax=Adiantum capillus-veneris TaxID=13818 RepID=A0A9D4U5N2_ADICA|nr:hypothetical protein GOP47_0024035 [Adiantum capillus-veneris]